MTETADQRFRAAFDRLKSGIPRLVAKGSPVSQNNVAKEAGVDPSALKLSRHPALIREIQAYVEIAGQRDADKRARIAKRGRAREEMAAQVLRLTIERDEAQSKSISAQRFLLEVIQERDRLRARIEEMLPPPTPLQRQ